MCEATYQNKKMSEIVTMTFATVAVLDKRTPKVAHILPYKMTDENNN